MKSTPDQLRSRGYLSDDAYDHIVAGPGFSVELGLLSGEAYLRTCAVRRIRRLGDLAFIGPLCGLLATEDALYTKLELCACLAEFGPASLGHLLPMLGRVGHNQHRVVGNFDLGKKSFPLPRDIVARVIIRLGPAALPGLGGVLASGDPRAVSEAIDAIGFIASESGDRSLEGELRSLYSSTADPVIRWKLVKALQAFSSAESRALLATILADPGAPAAMRAEAGRSLERMDGR